MEAQKKPELDIGINYQIRVSSKEDIRLTARYLGKGRMDLLSLTHIFVKVEENKRTYVFADDNWFAEEKGVLTYSPLGYFGVFILTDEQIKQINEDRIGGGKSALIKLLNGVGEKL